jgi:hypothetical protein
VPGGQISFPAAYGQQAHFPYLLMQNRPDWATAIVYPEYLATPKTAVTASVCQL